MNKHHVPAQANIDHDQIEKSRIILKESENETVKYKVNVCGKSFVVLPGVFSPKYFESTPIFSRHLPFPVNGSFLEIGCGTGATSVFAALNGARRVVAVDINPLAVDNTRINAARHGVHKTVQCCVSDIFSGLGNEEPASFDVIYWNMPFIPIESDYRYRSVLEMALFDPDYRLTQRFLKEAPRWLSKSGEVFVGFGNFGDDIRFRQIADSYGYSIEEIARESANEGNPVEFILYRLKPTNQVRDLV